MSEKRNVLRFVVDGKSYTEETYGENKAKDIPYLVATPEGFKEKTVFGFTTEDSIESWLSQSNLSENYQKLNELVSRSQRKLSSQEEVEASRIQAQVVDDATKRLENELKKHNIQGHEIDKMTDVLTNYDPFYGPTIHSLVLWPHCNYQGTPRVIPSGFAIPDFRWIGFNDVASSAFHFGAAHVLCQKTWFRGVKRYFFGVVRAACFTEYPWYFNDTASSAAGI